MTFPGGEPHLLAGAKIVSEGATTRSGRLTTRFVFGLLIGAFVFLLLWSKITHIPHALVAHLVTLAIGIAGIFAVIAWRRVYRAPAEECWTLPAMIALGIFAVPVILTVALTLTAPSVVRQAEAVGGDAPYCIQVSDGGADYRPASTWLDFSMLTMWGNDEGAVTLQFHAVLAVGEGPNPQVYNWSYRRWRFEEIQPGRARRAGPAVLCEPARNFAGGLALLASAAEDQSRATRIRIVGRDFTIPQAYASQISNGLREPLLSLDAEALSLPPGAARTASFRERVYVYLQPENFMHWLAPPQPQYVVEDRGEGLFGLHQRLLSWTDRDRSRRERLEFYARDTDGKVTTVLQCLPNPADTGTASCSHVFVRAGLLYRLRMKQNDLQHWRDREDRLAVLLSSFQSSAGK